MKPTHKHIILFLIAVNLFLQLFYWTYFRQQISTIYFNENTEGFWVKLIETFYPRFFTEKYRFDIHFFFKKTEQILWRFALISILFSGILAFFRKELTSFFLKKTVLERKKVVLLQTMLALGWLYESFTWYKSLVHLSQIKELYEPYLLLHLIPFPDTESLFFWFAIFYVFLLLSFVPRIASFFWSLSIILVVVLLGFLYGFSKIDHTYATWLYVSILLPFLLQNKSKVDAWALNLMQCVVAMVYLQTGLEKIFISGWDWFSPATLRSHLLLHPTTLGIQIANSPFLCILGSIFMISFQLGFASILFFPKLKYVFLISGVFFHISTFILMNIGGLVSFWYLVYVIYLLGEKNTLLTQENQ